MLDILAGAVIGIGSAYVFTTKYQKDHMELTYNSQNNQYLLSFNYKF